MPTSSQLTSARLTPAQLDVEYNNRARVPTHGQYFARWAAGSVTARAQGPRVLDQAYGEAPRSQLDVFTPKPASKDAGAPVLVFVHGGYWRSLDKSDHSFLAPALQTQGACVVLPNYGLCPATTLPGIALQLTQALAWVWRHIADFGGDPRRIHLVGHSAGAHLAAMLLACDWNKVGADLPADLVKSAIGISGLYELDSVRRTPFLQADLRLTPTDARRASPAWMAAPRKGSFLAVVGGNESSEFLRHNRLIQAAWGKKRVPVCEALAGHDHFSVLETLAAPGQRLHQLCLAQLGLAT